MKDCPGCNCENTLCHDLTQDLYAEIDARKEEINQLREAVRGLLLTGRERADDDIFGHTGYYYWEEKAWSVLKKAGVGK